MQSHIQRDFCMSTWRLIGLTTYNWPSSTTSNWGKLYKIFWETTSLVISSVVNSY